VERVWQVVVGDVSRRELGGVDGPTNRVFFFDRGPTDRVDVIRDG
jgi:hypothetical protein